MPWRNGPQARASGFDALRDRLPRSIAARLARAGLMAPRAPAPRPEPPQAAADGDRREDPAGASPRIPER
jgi:hypothetical protein